jgi:hypothetical protein
MVLSIDVKKSFAVPLSDIDMSPKDMKNIQ